MGGVRHDDLEYIGFDLERLAEADHPYAEREMPPKHRIDSDYPVCWWTAGDGVRRSAAP